MKKALLVGMLIVTVLLAGCRNFKLSAEIGSRWVSAEPEMDISIIDGNFGQGHLQLDGESIPIECHFGPGKTEFTVFVQSEYSEDPTNGDAWLFRGDYSYDEKNGTITLDLYGDQIGLNVQQIVLHEKTDN